jgi:hypothetical protein
MRGNKIRDREGIGKELIIMMKSATEVYVRCSYKVRNIVSTNKKESCS